MTARNRGVTLARVTPSAPEKNVQCKTDPPPYRLIDFNVSVCVFEIITFLTKESPTNHQSRAYVKPFFLAIRKCKHDVLMFGPTLIVSSMNQVHSCRGMCPCC